MTFYSFARGTRVEFKQCSENITKWRQHEQTG